MRLLPTAQTAQQKKALMQFLSEGKITLSEPCNCRGQVAHNNGGNYHEIVEFQMDGGVCLRDDTTTSDYAPQPDWQEVEFSEAIDDIAELAARGYHVSTPPERT